MSCMILVVDDTAYSREALALVLQSIPGVEVCTAASVRDAIRVLEGQPGIAALFTDLNMPFSDGFELIEKVRADRRFDKLPILVVSANAEPATPQRVMSLGANAFFPKPYSPLALRQTLEQLLHAKQSLRP
jgi:two-component system, chemotaxis family, chemotaxis protein CheY